MGKFVTVAGICRLEAAAFKDHLVLRSFWRGSVSRYPGQKRFVITLFSSSTLKIIDEEGSLATPFAAVPEQPGFLVG